nr:HEAT repeat containing protein 6 [Hymenolepis microstoma]
MQRKQFQPLTWPALIQTLAEKNFSLEAITALINEKRFPSYYNSLQLSDFDVTKSKHFLETIVDRLIEANTQQCLGYSRLSFLVCGVVRGNLPLFEENTFNRLLQLFLSIDTLPPNSEHSYAVATALSSLLYLRPVDLKSGHFSLDNDPSTTNSDLLGRHQGKMCLEKLASIFEYGRVEIKTEISCLHAVIQLLVHRTFLQCNSTQTETLSCISRIVKAIWPIAFILNRQTVGYTSGSNSSYGPSSASDLSDGWCGDFSESERPIIVNKKKARQMATYCLRSLLASKQVCHEIWSKNFGDKQYLQSSLLFAISREQDPSLREKFISILITVLKNLEISFTVAEELPNRDSASYISYSVRLANELREMHQSLHGALINEKVTKNQLGLLKAIGTLVSVTPYHRLQPGLLTGLINKTSAFLKNFQNDPVKFANLQVKILAIWSNILNKKNLTPELRSLITSKLDPVIFTGFQMPQRSSCWLIDLCLRILSESKFSTLRSQAASLLRSFVSMHFNLFHPFMDAVKAVIRQNLPPRKEDPVSTTLNILILCDTMLTHQFDCLEKGRLSTLFTDCEWWYDLMGTLLDFASKTDVL